MVVRLTLVASLLVAFTATAQAAEDAGSDETTALEQELTRNAAELTMQDCAIACRTIVSMRRVANRLCAIEPGPRCTAAREKLENASVRVREACPQCAGMAAQEPGEAPKGEPAPSAPQAVDGRTRGGCAGCATAGEEGAGGALAFTALLWALAVRARRRKKRP